MRTEGSKIETGLDRFEITDGTKTVRVGRRMTDYLEWCVWPDIYIRSRDLLVPCRLGYPTEQFELVDD